MVHLRPCCPELLGLPLIKTTSEQNLPSLFRVRVINCQIIMTRNSPPAAGHCAGPGSLEGRPGPVAIWGPGDDSDASGGGALAPPAGRASVGLHCQWKARGPVTPGCGRGATFRTTMLLFERAIALARYHTS